MTAQVYRSTDYGATAISTATTSNLVNMLTAVLVDGYGTQTPTSITQVAGLATCILPVAHGFPLGSIQNIFIAGCDQTNYNGNKTITVTSATNYTFSVPSDTVTPATGTITSKVPGAGWTKPFTNSTTGAVFRQGGGQQRYWQVDGTSTGSGYARVFGAEDMTAWNTATGKFPSDTQVAGGAYLLHSSLTTATSYVIVADNKSINMWFARDASVTVSSGIWSFFGDGVPNDASDPYMTITSLPYAATIYPHVLNIIYSSTDGSHTHVCRRYGGLGGSRAVAKLALTATTPSSLGVNASPHSFPNPIDGKLHYAPILLGDPLGIRGSIPGVYTHLHPISTFTSGDIFLGTGSDVGKCFSILGINSSGSSVVLETSPTW